MSKTAGEKVRLNELGHVVTPHWMQVRLGNVLVRG